MSYEPLPLSPLAYNPTASVAAFCCVTFPGMLCSRGCASREEGYRTPGKAPKAPLLERSARSDTKVYSMHLSIISPEEALVWSRINKQFKEFVSDRAIAGAWELEVINKYTPWSEDGVELFLVLDQQTQERYRLTPDVTTKQKARQVVEVLAAHSGFTRKTLVQYMEAPPYLPYIAPDITALELSTSGGL